MPVVCQTFSAPAAVIIRKRLYAGHTRPNISCMRDALYCASGSAGCDAAPLLLIYPFALFSIPRINSVFASAYSFPSSHSRSASSLFNEAYCSATPGFRLK